MIFVKSVTTPFNTPESNPLKTQWKLVQGLIYKFELYFPPGSSGLCGIALHDASVRLYPFGENEYFIGDNTTISFDDEGYFDSATAILDILSYNTDEEYNHTIQIRIGMLTDPILLRSRLGLSTDESISGPLLELIKLLQVQQSIKKVYDTSIAGEL